MVQKVLSPEERMARKFRLKCRFRALIRFVMQNTLWLKDVHETELTDDVMKNVAILTRDKNQIFGLTEKTILNTPKDQRTEQDKLHLQELIDKLRCFKNYPNKIKVGLSNVCGFAYYPPGRVIIREGARPMAMYVVLTGRVGIQKVIFDPILNENQIEDIGIVGPGHKFGEASILNKMLRAATCTTLEHTQLIVITAEDFNLVLRETVQEEWNEIDTGMKMFPLFNGFSRIKLRECCMMSNIQHFPPMTTIVGDKAGSPYFTYFIIKGKCRLIENLMVITTGKGKSRRYKRYQPPEDDETSEQDKISTVFYGDEISQLGLSEGRPIPSNVSVHCIEVCQMDSGYCFQLGENLKNRRICSLTPVTCLCIPRFWIFLHNHDKRWSLRLQFIDRHIPNTEKVFQAFELSRRWRDYKISLCEEVLRNRKKVTGTKICDLPLSLRLNCPLLYKE